MNEKRGEKYFILDEEELKNGLHVVFFVSRNKDNTNVENFKQRKKVFLTTRSPENFNLTQEFQAFANEGLPHEVSRFYYSVNKRNEDKVRKEVLHYLIDNPTFNLASLPQKVASLADRPEMALESKWMFDFDIKSQREMFGFAQEVAERANISMNDIKITRSINGWHLVVPHGFDTRELLEKWKDVELKRDGMILADWKWNVGGF